MLFVAGVIMMLISLPASRRLVIDRSITAMFDVADPTLVDYRELQAAFGGNAVVMLVYRDENLDSAAGFERNRLLSERVADIAGVKSQGILSPSVLSSAVEVISPQNLLSVSADRPPALIRPDDPIAAGFDSLFAGYTHSPDHGRAAVVAMLEPNHPPQTIRDLQQLAASAVEEFGPEISELSLVGEPVLVHDGFALIERDGAKLATMTVVLLSIVVLVSLVDVRFVLLLGAVIVWTIVVTKATMVWCAISLSLVSTILTAIITVIAVAAVLHLGVRFRTAIARGHSQRRATERTLEVLVWPIFWTCATDAAGFAALCWSRIVPVQQFGLMIALAAGCVFVAVALLAPAIMMLPAVMIGGGFHARQARFARRLRRRCVRLAGWTVRHRGIAVVVASVLLVVALVGTWDVQTETSFLNNFRDHSPVVRAYDDVENNFGGAGVWDVVLDAPEQLDGEYLTSVRQLEDELRNIKIDGEGLTKVLSLADADEIAAGSMILRFAPPSMRLSGMQLKMPVFFNALLTARPQDRKLRIMLRSKEHLSAGQKGRLIEKVQLVVTSHTSSDEWRGLVGGSEPGKVTGYYVMMARLVQNLVGDQWRCFLVSGLLVWALLMGATRSFRLATAALLPNLLPVFLVLALVGFLGGKINMGAAMIAAVSIGLSIDGSVHLLASYRRHRRRGHPVETSAVFAAGNIGVPVLLATIALVIGFSVLATSEFIPTATFGVLIAATLTAGTAINLTLLPALIAWCDRAR